MPLKSWPTPILDEYATVEKLQEGFSISRFGDGEASIIAGGAQVREPANPRLAAELLAILTTPQQGLIVGIPTMDPAGPKYTNWKARAPRFLRFLAKGMLYGSAFISRPDSAPAIQTGAYCEALQRCWTGKKVVVVAEATSKLPTVVEAAARKTVHIVCPRREAYAVLPQLDRLVLRERPEIVLLSHGPSATCFAARLARRGLQALDLGSIGGFLARMLATGKLEHVFPFALRHPQFQGDAEAIYRVLEAAGFHVCYGPTPGKGEKSPC